MEKNTSTKISLSDNRRLRQKKKMMRMILMIMRCKINSKAKNRKKKIHSNSFNSFPLDFKIIKPREKIEIKDSAKK